MRAQRIRYQSIVAPPLLGTYTHTWDLPTTDALGAPIGTITLQTVYWDSVSRFGTPDDYANSVVIADGVTFSRVITGLAPGGTYYFNNSVTVGGRESDLGPETEGIAA